MKAASQVAVTEAEDPLLGFLKKKEPEKKDQKKGLPVTEGGLAPFRAGETAAPPASSPRPVVLTARPSGSAPRSVNKLADFATSQPDTTIHVKPNCPPKSSPINSDALFAPDAIEGKAARPEPLSSFFCPTCGAKQTAPFCGVCGTKFPVAEPVEAKPISYSHYVQVEDYVEELKATAGLLDRIQATVSPEVSDLYIDDWSNVSAQITGEKPSLLNINDVAYCRPRRTIMGVLVMTPYQLFFEPVKITKYSKRVYGSNTSGVVSVPLASIERLDIAQVPSKSRRDPGTILDAYCKDTRLLRFAFRDADQCKRASQVIAGYVFPGPENPKYLFCFTYQTALMKAFQTQNLWKDGPLGGRASPVDGWQLFNPIREYKRMGLPTSELVISLVNENYSVCPTYPAVLALPASFSEADIRQIANFRSRGRIPALSWKHPFGDQSIWRCSQPKTGVAGVRCLQDEELLKKIKAMNPGMKDKPLTIFDCRPRLNAWANKTAGKGFEDTQYYTSCKLRFMNIENIHTMRIAYQKLAKACQKQIDDQEFPKGVIESGWLFHLSEVIKATVEMVITVDRDGCSIMSHCSDGWDRTAQLVALSMLCLDPYYRTTVGFLRLIDKEWLSFGHKFGERTGHGDKNYNDEQRAPIFLQWLDCVYQFTCQFPRHFQFNSAFLVCLASHLYSCRFGTFLFDTECERDKFELKSKTASLWSYLLVSPAALDGHFTNPFYSFGGDGDLTLENCQQYRQTSAPQKRHSPPPSEVTETVDGEIVGDIVGEMGDDEVDDEHYAGPRSSKVPSCSPQNGRGSVLCPSWSLKRLTVWSDYYLRWNTEETQTIGHGVGLMPPYGSATTTLISSESLYHQQMRNYQRTVTELSEAKERIRQLELQLTKKSAPDEEKKEVAPPAPEASTAELSAPPLQPALPAADVEKNLDSLIAELDMELGEQNRPSEPLSASLDHSAMMSFDALVSPMGSEDGLFTSSPTLGSSDFSLSSSLENNPFGEPIESSTDPGLCRANASESTSPLLSASDSSASSLETNPSESNERASEPNNSALLPSSESCHHSPQLSPLPSPQLEANAETPLSSQTCATQIPQGVTSSLFAQIGEASQDPFVAESSSLAQESSPQDPFVSEIVSSLAQESSPQDPFVAEAQIVSSIAQESSPQDPFVAEAQTVSSLEDPFISESQIVSTLAQESSTLTSLEIAESTSHEPSIDQLASDGVKNGDSEAALWDVTIDQLNPPVEGETVEEI